MSICDNCTCGKAEGCSPETDDFRKELEMLINRYSKENGSDTPDFILAQFLEDSLKAFDKAVSTRTEWTTPGAPF